MLLTVNANIFPSLDKLTFPPNQSPALPIKSSPTFFSIDSEELENNSKVDELPTVVQVISSAEDSHLMVKSPVPSGSSASSLILKIFPTVAVPLIEKLASPSSTNGILDVEVVTISSKPCVS